MIEQNWYAPMRMAIAEATRSPDPSTQNGAVVMYEGRIVGAGSNTFTMGTCMDLNLVPREEKYLYVEHAERMALFSAASSGHRADTLVCPWAACAECARAIVASGVKRLVRLPTMNDALALTDRWSISIDAGNKIMENGGVEIISYETDQSFGGIGLRRNGELLEF